MKKQVCLLLSGLLLAGCAGQHHRPPAGITSGYLAQYVFLSPYPYENARQAY